ncbi:MAG: peptidoglycan-binding protein, partial [Bacillota bacterium]|nr:peptidoglycan-binding protein [Bacillota bacterium]
WGSYGVHGTNNSRIIGKQVSNGCIRMFNQDVCEVFEHMLVGARVLLTGNPYGTNVFDRTLRLGDMGSDVFLVQEQLRKLGLLSTRAEGIFGPDTEAALRRYQLQADLAGTGVFDKATRAKMFGVVGRRTR